MSSATGAVATATGLLARARSVLVLTGAGISTDSGIPDFRGPQGLWRRDPAAERLSNVADFMASAEVRRRSWRGFAASGALDARPNAGHLALVSLERRGSLVLLATQNTDGLHLAAGHDPGLVVELHGSSRTTRCASCGDLTSTVEVLARVRAGDEDPRCERRAGGAPCGGMLRRGVVLFGEELPSVPLRQASSAAGSCDLLLAVGSTLSVWPAAGLVPLAARRGAPVVIVNGAPTAMDATADVVVRGPIGEVLPELLAAGP